MDRRAFLSKTCAFISLLGANSVLGATGGEVQKGENTKEKLGGDKQPVRPFVPGSWTLVILPDTQKYAEKYPGIFMLQTQWIKDNKDKYNIAYVLQNGDITEHNTELQWEKAFGQLDFVTRLS